MANLENPEQSVSSLVRLSWLNADPNAHAEGLGPQAGTSNYLLGNNPRHWHTSVPRYDKVRFAGLYRGIDLEFHGDSQNRVEMDYILSPHADASAIRIGIGGPSVVELDDKGQLSISGQGDEVVLRAPVAYQDFDACWRYPWFFSTPGAGSSRGS